MSLTIAIQACCQVFQITYEDLVSREMGLDHYSKFITERKFSIYYCSTFDTRRMISKHFNISDTTAQWYRECIKELIEEDPRHYVIIQAIEDKYNEIQSKRIKAALYGNIEKHEE